MHGSGRTSVSTGERLSGWENVTAPTRSSTTPAQSTPSWSDCEPRVLAGFAVAQRGVLDQRSRRHLALKLVGSAVPGGRGRPRKAVGVPPARGGLDGRVGDPPDRRAARQNHQLGALICASWPAAPAPPAPPPTPRSRGTVDGRDGVSCRMQRIPEAGLTRLTRAASLLLLLPLLLVLAAGHLPGGSASARGGTSSDQAQVSWPVGVGNYGWIGALPAGAAGTRPAVPPGARAAATSRAQAPAPSSPAAVTSGSTDRTAARARPVLAWAPEVVLLAGPPLLPGQLPRPPSAVDPRTDPGPSRGRAPPGSAGT